LRSDLHAKAALLIQHPRRHNKLITAGQSHLNLMLAKGRTTPHDHDRRAAMRMVWVVNRRRNMGSV
jgi:hypothetical protein